MFDFSIGFIPIVIAKIVCIITNILAIIVPSGYVRIIFSPLWLFLLAF